MEVSALTYDADTDLWAAPNGDHFLRNVFREDAPVWIQVGMNRWRARYLKNTHVISWPRSLDPEFSAAARRIVHERMKSQAPSSLSRYALIVNAIAERSKTHGVVINSSSFGNIDTVSSIWSALTPGGKVTFREMYRHFVDLDLCGADRSVADRMREWKARNNVQTLRDVIRWDPDRGALSTSELEVLRRVLEDPTQDNTDADHFVRMSLRIYLATLRRPSQILQIGSDGLRRVTSNCGEQFFLKIPKVKGQAGAESDWEAIPSFLAWDIEAYRNRPAIARLCRKSDLLLPHVIRGDEQAELSTAYFNSVCKAWFKRRNIVSPRTKRTMSFAMTRLRHTGATQMAMQGYARQLIQDVLQHDSPESANAYIDSVGADTLPLFEKMDDRLGSRFSHLKNAWFFGRIVEADQFTGSPIIVPTPSAPAIVGACGNPAPCVLHPLFSCYSCQHFLAFRQADHLKTLAYVEQEYARWRDAEIGSSRSKAMKDFERIAVGVRDVIDRIERGKSGDAE